MRVVGHRDDLDLAAAAQRAGAHPGALPDEAPPVLRPAQRPLDAGRRHLQHVPRPDHRPRFQEALEGPADSRAVVGRDPVAGPAVRAVHPHLQDRALQRSDAPEIDELEPEAGDVIANRCEERVDETSGLQEKKCGGTPPHRQSARTSAPGTAPKYYRHHRQESIGARHAEIGHHAPVGAARGAVTIEVGAVVGAAPAGAGHPG